MTDLITRLSELDAPDREVDAEIDVIFFGGETVWKQANYTMEQFPASKRASRHHISGYAYEYVPAFTASVDAAIALAERVLPGCKVGLLPNFYRAFPYAGVIVEAGNPVDLKEAIIDGGATPAIALCIALLRAKEAST
ncbi:hypothetical protein NJB93_19615 [Brucella intermedia]|uniref:hypothetical protein n=1 Tax=Brucella intermedia TaxID=94625 RepID=UPI00209B131A|nr:hypothetical protein [Brucella intermedia]MCO7728791.1 hypothetical protein [Brucella intermedia]